MPKLTIFVKSHDVITVSSSHFAHGGHFANMRIRMIYVFGYINLRFMFNGENHLHMMFDAILNSAILIWVVLGFLNNHKYIQILY